MPRHALQLGGQLRRGGVASRLDPLQQQRTTRVGLGIAPPTSRLGLNVVTLPPSLHQRDDERHRHLEVLPLPHGTTTRPPLVPPR